jgi:hypothetical protein
MPQRTSGLVWKPLFALLALLLLAGDALAYVGPTPGPEFVGYFMSLVALLGVTLSALVLWPIHALRRLFFGRRAKTRPADVPPVLPEGTPKVDSAHL